MRRFHAGLAIVAVAACAISTEPARGQETGGKLTGRVVTDVSGYRSPLRRATVTATRQSDSRVATTTTGSDGEYVLDGLTPERYLLEAAKAGYAATGPRAAVDVKAESDSAVDLVLQRGGALEGRFLNYLGEPITQLTVIAEPAPGVDSRGATPSSRSAVTDDLGRFRVHTLQPGAYVLYAPGAAWFYPGTESRAEANVLAIASGQTLDRLEIVVPRSPETTGTVERAIPVASATTGTPGSAQVKGRLIRVDSGQPVADAVVQLTAMRFVDTTTTDDSGRFLFADLAAGQYSLTARAAGFVSADGSAAAPGPAIAGPRLTLKDGQRIEIPDIVLAPTGAIEGRLLDEFGDPAPGVVVQVTRRSDVAGKSRFVTGAGIATARATDDLGRFRVSGLAPGDYYLIAVPEPFERSGPAGFAPTFFPGTTSVDGASAVRLAPGSDAHDVTFGVVAARTTAIAGVVMDEMGRPVPKASVLLLPTHGDEVRAMVMASTTADTEGGFSYRNVPEGTYVIQAMAPRKFGSVALAATGISGQDAVRATVPLKPLTTARGRVSLDGSAAPPRPESILLRFLPADFTSGPAGSNLLQGRIDSKWNFEIPNLAWHGMIRVASLPGWSLAQVRLGGRDITDTPYDFQTADVSGLEVILTSRVGTISGTVQKGRQPSSGETVVVFGADDSDWPSLSRTLRVGRADEAGAFTFRDLPAGRYFAAALLTRPQSLDAPTLLSLRTGATLVVVTERGEAKITLVK